MSIESSFRPDLEPIDEFVESKGKILEYSNNNLDNISKPTKWICGIDENGKLIHPLGVNNPIYTHLDDKGRWIGTTGCPEDMKNWDIH